MAVMLLVTVLLHAHALSVDPAAALRPFKQFGRSIVGPGVCGLTIECAPGYIDNPSAIAIPGMVDPPRRFTNDTSKKCTNDDVIDPSANYMCSSQNFARCASDGETCVCSDLCATGPLCNQRRDRYEFEASHLVWNGVSNVRVSLGTMSGRCYELTEVYRQTTPDHQNHVLLAEKSGFNLSYVPTCERVFGPRGCSQFDDLFTEYRCVENVAGHAWNNPFNLPESKYTPSSDYTSPVVLQEGDYRPALNRTRGAVAVCCPRGMTLGNCNNHMGCTKHGCDNGGTCKSDRTCSCPLGTLLPYCRSCPCKNGGKCVQDSWGWGSRHSAYAYMCSCPSGWGGSMCEEQNPCLNGGEWISGPRRSRQLHGALVTDPPFCKCAMGFNGTRCESTCPAGYANLEGRLDCILYVGCLSGGCANGGTCVQVGYPQVFGHCTMCENGWTGPTCTESCLDWKGPGCESYDYDERIIEEQNIKYPGGIPMVTLGARQTGADQYEAIGFQEQWNHPMTWRLNCTRLDPNATRVDGRCVCEDPCLTGLACNIRVTSDTWVKRLFPEIGPSQWGHPAAVFLANAKQWNTTHVLTSCTNIDQVQRLSDLRVSAGLPKMYTAALYVKKGQPKYNPCYLYGPQGCGVGFVCQPTERPMTRRVSDPFYKTWTDVNTLLDGVCCRYGYTGPNCKTYSGCVGTPCLNGGKCLTTLFGKALPAAETKCFGCNAGVNGTTGWTGTFCELPLAPTYIPMPVSLVPGIPAANRRLLQASDETAYLSVRASYERSSDKGGKIYREPARACDCNVQWQNGVTADITDANPGKPLVQFGNYASWSHDVSAVMLSPLRFEAQSPILPVWRRKVSSHAEARYQASVDFGVGGYYAETPDATGSFYVSFWYDNTRTRVLQGLARPAPHTARYVYTNMLNRPGQLSLTRYDLDRSPDKTKCASMTFDPAFYYNKYPSQCDSVRTMGGIGNLRFPNNTVPSHETLAYLHFHFFGHRVRNQPNAECDLSGDWAEDETGCVNKLRYPKTFYPLSANETLTEAVCGNVSRIEPSRIAFGNALKPGATGTNITDDGQPMCQCYPPFRAANETAQQDCSFDMCGTVDKRGLVNASHAGYFTETAKPEACVCQGIWGTDPDTCVGNRCDWCAATVCHNGGTANGSDYEAGCQCAPIFNGTLCQNNLCNPQHSFPHNASLWTDRLLEQIVCDCHPGWTGTLCDEMQCVNGEYSFQQQKCLCFEGWNAGTQGICDDAKCIRSHGLWNSTKQGCDCEHPWKGDRCEIDSCDEYNSVLEIPGWDGMRPFGQSVISEVDGLWTCKCNWPYMALNRTSSDDDLDDRNWDCKANDCGHGIPTPNRDWLNRTVTKKAFVNGQLLDQLEVLPPVPSEACTCRDPYGIGILTDPTRCVGMSHKDCPNSCLVATCQLTSEKIELIGGYVPVASSDPSCCMCPASAMFQANGTCQHFCRFYQPCLTTERSSFAFNPNYTSDPFAFDNITREYDEDTQQYVCTCNAYYTNTSPDMNDCGNYTYLAPDPRWNLSGNIYGPDYDNIPNTPTTSSSGGGGLSSAEQALAIGLSVGMVVLVGAVQGLSTWFKGAKVATEAGEKIVSSVVEGTLDGIKSTMGPETSSSSSSKLGTRVTLQLSLLAMVCLLAMEVQSADSENPLDSDWWAKSDWSPKNPGVFYTPAIWNHQSARDIALAEQSKTNRVRGNYRIPMSTANQQGRLQYVSQYGAFPEISFTLGQGVTTGWQSKGAWTEQTSHPAYSNEYWMGTSWPYADAINPKKGTPKCADSHLVSSSLHGGSPTPLSLLPFEAEKKGLRLQSRERTCKFSNADQSIPNRVGMATMTLNTLTWSMFQYAVSNASPFQAIDVWTTYFALNICSMSDSEQPCGAFGTCVIRSGMPADNSGSFMSYKDQFIDLEVYTKFNIFIGDMTNTESWAMHGEYLLRGCHCSNGHRGLRCQERCPVITPGVITAVCSNRGTCASGKTVTNPITLRTCLCEGGCTCERGWSGDRCDLAVQSKELYIFGDATNVELTDIGECCPDGVTDCSVRTNAFTSKDDTISVIPRIPCPGPIGSSCGAAGASVYNYDGPVSGFTDDARISQHLSAETAANMGLDKCGQFATLHGFEGVGNNGRGQCWAGIDSPTTSASKTFCWCNPDQKEYQKVYRMGANGVATVETTTQLSMIPRRGFYGNRCKLRTCTSRIDGRITVPDRVGNLYQLVVEAPLVNGYAQQCSGHSIGQFNGNSTNYDDDDQPCDDKAIRERDATGTKWVFRNVNTDGRCKQCEHGWGIVPGYHILALKGTSYPTYESPDSLASYGSSPNGDQGVCAVQTFHTNGGHACGGYYDKLVDSRINQLPAGASTKGVLYVGGCDCGPKEWGLIKPDRSGGICQRTCAGNTATAAIPLEFFDSTGAFKGNDDYSQLVAPDPPKCGGYKQGICRPINGHGWDGWNSACLCNAGYNGPDCAKDESMWKDGVVCGPDAEPYIPERPAGIKEYSKYVDEDFFHRSIVPLQGEQLLSKTAYSMHKCRCKNSTREAKWEMFGNFCGPSCETLRSAKWGNMVCGGATRGTCIDNPLSGAVGKVCRCTKGWAGPTCDTRILHDKLGRECGGPGRGNIVFKDVFNMTQKCDCVAPFVPNPIAGEMNGTCWADCPVNPITKLKCTGESQGACTLDHAADGLNAIGTGNDNVCICTKDAFEGKDCSQRLVAVYTTQNGRVMPCTGHGIPDPDRNGFCRCDPGWIGFACEIYHPNRQCGTGQTFLDHEALGYNVY